DRVRVVRVRGGLVDGDADGLRFTDAVQEDAESAYLGTADGWSYVADLGPLTIPDEPRGRVVDDPQGPPSGLNVRDVGAQLDARDASLATTAVALANWHQTHRFCPRCGAPTQLAVAGWERHCAADGRP